jgi:circadian clock protein KaiB
VKRVRKVQAPASWHEKGPTEKVAEVKPRYVLRLFVAGATERAAAAIQEIKSICKQHLSKRYQLEVVDIYQQPTLASREQVVAAPTLVKSEPPPRRRLIGDMKNRKKVLAALDIIVKETHGE